MPPNSNILNSVLFVLVFFPIYLSGGANSPNKDTVAEASSRILLNERELLLLKAANKQKELKLEEILQDYELTYRSDSLEY